MVELEVSEMIVEVEVEVEKRRRAAVDDDNLAIDDDGELDNLATKKLPLFGADDDDEAAAAVPSLHKARDNADAATARARGADGGIAGG